MNSLELEEAVRVDERSLESNLQEIYEDSPCGYVSMLPDGTLIRINRTLLRWLEYRAEDLVKIRTFQSLLTVPCRIFYETHMFPLVQMQGRAEQIAMDLLTLSGRTIHCFVNTTQVIPEASGPVLYRSTIFDASDRRAYERELLAARRIAEQSTETKSRLLSMISHEMRAPLQAIQMVTEILEATNQGEDQQKALRILRSSSQNLLRFVNQILEYSRIEAGGVALSEIPFSLAELVQEVLVPFQPQADRNRVSLSSTLDSTLPGTVLADRTRIQQVLTNLVGNAVKFTSQGEVHLDVALIQTRAGSVVVRFSVRDTGIGIPHDRIASIFEEFSQASSEISSKFGGSGLGLWICRKLLRLMNSDLHVESSPARGSTFSFALKLKTK